MKNPNEILDAALAELDKVISDGNRQISAEVQRRQNTDALITALQADVKNAEQIAARIRPRPNA